MKNALFFILLFCCYSSISIAQNINNKIAFGTKPNCGAGKGVCSLVMDDNQTLNAGQIGVNASFNELDNSFAFTFKLSDFKNIDPLHFGAFIDENDNPKTPQIFDYCYLIDPAFAMSLGCSLPSPGIMAGQAYTLLLDKVADMVTLKFHYSEVISCTNP